MRWPNVTGADAGMLADRQGFAVIGPVTRLEDAALLRGRGRFVDGIALPGMLHVAFLRSPIGCPC